MINHDDAQRRPGARQLGRAARAACDRGGDVRPRLLGVQPLGAAGRRESLAAPDRARLAAQSVREPRAIGAAAACSGERGSRGGASGERTRRARLDEHARRQRFAGGARGAAMRSCGPTKRLGLVATMFIDTPPETWFSQARYARRARPTSAQREAQPARNRALSRPGAGLQATARRRRRTRGSAAR